MAYRKILRYGIAALLAMPAVVSFPTTGWTQIPEMVVSVRKREEFLQDIPISITVLSADQITRFNLNDVRDIANYSSSLIFNPGFFPPDQKIIIRGIRNTRGRPSSAFLVDGIDVTSESISTRGNSLLATTRLLDIERVEVIMGPQSALYGRSAFAGAIQYVTKDPSDEFEVHVNADIGNYARYDVSGGVSGPVIADVLGLRLNANWWDQKGFYKDFNRLSNLGGGDGWGIALTAKLDAGDRLSFKARVEYADDDFDSAAKTVLPDNTFIMGPQSAIDIGLADSNNPYFFGEIPDNAAGHMSRPQPNPLTGEAWKGSFRELLRFSLASEWDLDFGTITAWTGSTNSDSGYEKNSNNSIPVGPIGMTTDTAQNGQMARERKNEVTQFSQELRFGSDWDFPVQFTFGGLYWKEKVDRVAENTTFSSCSPTRNNCVGMTSFTAAPFVEVISRPLEREVTSWSGYGLLEWQIFDQWKVSAEARYTKEKEITHLLECDQDATALALGFGVVTPGTNQTAPATCPRGPSTVSLDLIHQAPHQVLRTVHKENFVTPRFVLEWTPNDNTLIYLQAAKAIKPGGTSTGIGGAWVDINFDGNIEESLYDAENLWAYELGAKKTWLDNTLRTNAAVFFQSYKDRQVSTQQPDCCGSSTSLILNAGAAEILGFEFDGMWQANDHWTFTAGYTFLDANYTFFESVSSSSTSITEAGNCTPVIVVGEMTCNIVLTGNRLEGIPKHNFVGTASYRAPVAPIANWFGYGNNIVDGMDWFIEGDAFYMGNRFVDESNRIILQSSTRANLRLGVSAERWEALFYTDNVFDDDTILSAADIPGHINRELFNIATGSRSGAPASSIMAYLPPPRTFGVRMKFQY